MGDAGTAEPRWFFYCDMSKQEVLDRLRASREINVMDDTNNWRDAFALYNASTGNKVKTSDRCSKCFQRVLDWLQGVK